MVWLFQQIQIVQNLQEKFKKEYFNKSIDLDPNNFSAKNNLGNSYKAIGRYDLAESNY